MKDAVDATSTYVHEWISSAGVVGSDMET
jgi:hypothetical protein